MDSRFLRTLILVPMLCLAIDALTVAHAQPEQSVHRADFQPVTDEVFAVVELFYDLDETLPLETRIVEEWETESGRFAKLVYTTQSGERVPGDLVRPVGGGGPFPAVLLLHGLGNDRDRWWEDDRRSLPEGLIEAGIAVMTIDLRYHGERSAQNDYESPVYLTFGNDLHVRSRDMVVDSTVDARRALRVLRAREDIDASRIAVVGYSMGGSIACRLSTLEPDLAAAVFCAMPMSTQVTATDPFNFAARSNVPTRLLIGRTDWLSSPDDANTLLKLLRNEASELTLYEAGHRLPPQFAIDAREWLLSRLR